MPLEPETREHLEAQESEAVEKLHKLADAEAILRHPLVVEAVETYKNRAWQEFAKSSVDDDASRLSARLKIDAMDAWLAHLRGAEREGSLWKRHLQDIRDKLDRLRERRSRRAA